MDTYDIFQYKYKNKKGKLKMIVYARTDDVAKQIIDINNTNSIFYWVPVVFGFKKPIKINIPPYELEQEQLNVSYKKLEYRLKIAKDSKK